MIRIFIILLIVAKSFSSYADTRIIYKCNKDIHTAFYDSYKKNEVSRGISGKRKFCLAEALIKHFQE